MCRLKKEFKTPQQHSDVGTESPKESERPKNEDRFDVHGKKIVMKLKELPKGQRSLLSC